MPRRNQTQRSSCPFELAMDIFGGKWKGMIIFRLHAQPQRFTDLKNNLKGISNRILTLALRELEQDGVIARNPKTVSTENEYALTAIGQQLVPAFLQIRQWGLAYQAELKTQEDLKPSAPPQA